MNDGIHWIYAQIDNFRSYMQKRKLIMCVHAWQQSTIFFLAAHN